MTYRMKCEPVAVHHLKDGPLGGCAESALGCVLYFRSEEECLHFISSLSDPDPFGEAFNSGDGSYRP
jgi:hypothetical protein